MYIIGENEIKKHDYVTYPRQFDSHRWYKPIFVAILGVLFYGIFLAILMVATGTAAFMMTGGDLNGYLGRFSGGYDNMQMYDAIGVIVNMGSVAVMLPSLILANAIVNDRPFTSYSSSRGGWSWIVFIKTLLIAAVVVGGPMLIHDFYFQEHGPIQNKFSEVALWLLFFLVPLQCIAEEYMFRAFLNQTLGSWCRVPIIAILLSSVGFAALHPYNRVGQITIFASGVFMGLASWFGRGVEVSSAMHIVNNMVAFLVDGFGISKISSEVSIEDMVMDIAIGAAYVGVIFLLSRKTNWFSKAKYDDAANANEERAAMIARKQAIKEEKLEKKEAKKEAREEAHAEAKKNAADKNDNNTN